MTAAQDTLRGHSFDDIVEFDNRLPNWWLWSLYLACIFSLGYWVHYHILGTGPSSQQEYMAEMAALDKQMAAVVVTDDMLLAKATDAIALASGQAVFQASCFACPGATGGGTMLMEGQVAQLPGPNLTDRFWLHGGDATAIYRTITEGVPNTAMVPWGPMLGTTKCQDVSAYVVSLRNTNAAGGKEPQGQEYSGR